MGFSVMMAGSMHDFHCDSDGAHAAVEADDMHIPRRHKNSFSWSRIAGYAAFGIALVGNNSAYAAPSKLSMHEAGEHISEHPSEVAEPFYSTKEQVAYDPTHVEPSVYTSTAPVMLNTSSLLVGGLLALMALMLALSTQKDKKSISPNGRSNQTAPGATSATGKVRWRLGDSSSDDETSTNRWRPKFNTPTTPSCPSYDGCYYMADPVDDKSPSPQSSRRNFGY